MPAYAIGVAIAGCLWWDSCSNPMQCAFCNMCCFATHSPPSHSSGAGGVSGAVLVNYSQLLTAIRTIVCRVRGLFPRLLHACILSFGPECVDFGVVSGRRVLWGHVLKRERECLPSRVSESAALPCLRDPLQHTPAAMPQQAGPEGSPDRVDRCGLPFRCPALRHQQDMVQRVPRGSTPAHMVAARSTRPRARSHSETCSPSWRRRRTGCETTANGTWTRTPSKGMS